MICPSVEADHADLGAVEIGKIDVLKNGLLVVVFTDADHRIDNFVIEFGNANLSGWMGFCKKESRPAENECSAHEHDHRDSSGLSGTVQTFSRAA